MLWIETPTNPLLKYVDVEQACKIAHKYGLIVVVDNTFLTPYYQVGGIHFPVEKANEPATNGYFSAETFGVGC